MKGKVVTFKDLKLFVDTCGLKISLTPCRRAANHAEIFIDYRHYNPIKDRLHRFDPNEFKETPFEYFELLVNFLDFDLIRNTQRLTPDTSSIYNFLKKAYNIVVPVKAVNKEQAAIIEDKIDAYYTQKKIPRQKEDFLKRYFNYFIEPKLKNESIEIVLSQLFYSHLPNPYNRIKNYLYEEHVLEVYVSDFAVEFPETILRQWDINNNKPFIIESEKFNRVRALIPVSKLTYKNIPEEHIEIIKTDSACFTTSEITGTGIILSANDVLVDFYSKSIAPKDKYDYVYQGMSYPAHEKYKWIGPDASQYIAEPDDYLRNFMGVVIPHCNVKIPCNNDCYIQAIATDLLIDGNEINGVIKVPVNNIPLNWDELKLRKHLENIGLIIHNTPSELEHIQKNADDNSFKIYFTFKPNI